jgi:hypothetical protein
LAREAIGNTTADYLFDGSMEGDFDRGYAPFTEFMKGMADAGPLDKSPTPRLHHPLFVKTHEIAPDPALARERIGKQLNLGVQWHRLRRRRERGGSENRPCRDALQVQRRDALG